MQQSFLSLVWLCCLHFCPTLQFKKFYIRYPSLNHRSCNPDDLIFTLGCGDLKCSAMCLYTLGCTSLFWNPNSAMCYGCRKSYTSATGLPGDSGALYFLKYSEWGEGCAGDWQCKGGYQKCLTVENEATCRCTAGYPFDVSTGECVPGCAAYGDTYQMHPFVVLRGTKISSTWKREYIGSRETCRAECDSSATCRSVDHSLNGWCILNTDTAATASLEANLNVAHYERNCAP